MNACSGNVLSKKVLEYQVDHLLGGERSWEVFVCFCAHHQPCVDQSSSDVADFATFSFSSSCPTLSALFLTLGGNIGLGRKRWPWKILPLLTVYLDVFRKGGILWEFCQQERLSLCDFWQTNLVTLTKFTQGNYYHHHANLNHHQLNHVHGHHHRHKAVQKSECRQSPVSLGDIGRAFYWGCSSTAFRLRHPSLTSDEDHAEDIDVEDEYEEANDDHPLLPPQITTSFLVYGPKKSSFARAES